LIGEKQRKVLAFQYSRYDALICDGAIRSGKTSVMFWAYVRWAMESFDGCNFIVLGKTVGSAVRNVIDPFLMMAETRRTYSARYKRSECMMQVRGFGHENRFMVFGAKDESSYMLIQGFTAAGCFVDETALCVESAVNQALARCSVDGSRFWFNCNPGSPTHWFYKGWIQRAAERNALYLHFTMEDNPGISDRVRKRYESQYSGVFYARYILGLWTQAEGLVYPSHEDAYEERYTGEAVQRCVSVDYGTQNPCVAIMWAKSPDGVWHATDEYYYSGREEGRQKTNPEYVRDLVKFCSSMPPGEVEVIVDPSATSFIAELRRYEDKGRFFRVRKAKNDIISGIEDTASAMQVGKVKFAKTMRRTDEEFKSYVWDPKGDSDRPVKENDHAMDAIRYLIYTKRVMQDEAEGAYASPFGRFA
jgi:PBSX family phage terminase large subunit